MPEMRPRASGGPRSGRNDEAKDSPLAKPKLETRSSPIASAVCPGPARPRAAVAITVSSQLAIRKRFFEPEKSMMAPKRGAVRTTSA